MKIGELSKRSGLSRDTLRFYERKGLITSQPPLSEYNSYREYAESLLERLELIRQAQAMGFTLAKIQEALDPYLEGELTPDFKKKQLIDQIVLIDSRIGELQNIRKALSAKLEQIGS